MKRTSPKYQAMVNIPSRKPASPMRFTMNALLAAVASGLAMEVEPDQQVRAQAHAFPSDKHQRVVVPQDQRQHGEHEQVQVSEEAVVPALVRHVAGGVDVDEHADAGDEQQPDTGEGIEQEAGIGLERRRSAVALDVVHVAGIAYPATCNDLLERFARIVVSVVCVLPDRAAGERRMPAPRRRRKPR